jgi:SanA protein
MVVTPLKKRAIVVASTLTAALVAALAASWAIVGGDPCIIDVAEAPACPVAIVPGAGVWPSGPSPVLEDRLATALELRRAGRVRKLLLSGDHGRRGYDEPGAMAAWLERRGVPPEDLFLDHAGFDTRDTLARARLVFGVERALVVSQEFHLPRALWLARELGIDAVGVRADRRVYDLRSWYLAREAGARLKAAVEVKVLRRGPRFLGPPIPIDGDGRVTRDL